MVAVCLHLVKHRSLKPGLQSLLYLATRVDCYSPYQLLVGLYRVAELRVIEEGLLKPISMPSLIQ